MTSDQVIRGDGLKRAASKNWLEHLLQIARFGVVGVGATLVQLGAAWLLHHFTPWPLFAVNTLAFLIAFLFSVSGHYFWTFQPNTGFTRSLLKFFPVSLCGYIVSTFVLAWLIHRGVGGDYFKLLISTLVIPPVTFTVGKLWVFAE